MYMYAAHSARGSARTYAATICEWARHVERSWACARRLRDELGRNGQERERGAARFEGSRLRNVEARNKPARFEIARVHGTSARERQRDPLVLHVPLHAHLCAAVSHFVDAELECRRQSVCNAVEMRADARLTLKRTRILRVLVHARLIELAHSRLHVAPVPRLEVASDCCRRWTLSLAHQCRRGGTQRCNAK